MFEHFDQKMQKKLFVWQKSCFIAFFLKVAALDMFQKNLVDTPLK